MVGGGPDATALADRVRELPDPSRVRLAGDVTDPRPWLAAADLVVLPSRWEGMALAPLEAMATARPVLLSDVPGARECLPPELLGGGLVAPEDPAGLAQLIVRALKDPIECERLGLVARERMSDHHDVREVVRQVELLYRNLLRDGVPGPVRRSTATPVSQGGPDRFSDRECSPRGCCRVRISTG